MPDYDWTCHACGKTVAASLENCDACGCPAKASAADVEAWKRNGKKSNAHTPLPVVRIIVGAVAIPWQRRSRMALALLPPATGLLITGQLFEHFWETKWWGYYLSVALVSSLLFTLFAVTCHRLVLLGDQAVSRFGLFKWSSRETRFFGWMVAIWSVYFLVSFFLAMVAVTLANVLPSDDLGSLAWLLVLPVWFPVLYLLSRFSLVLPATAIDKRPSLSWAWQRTEGNGWRLVLVVGLLPWVLSFGLGLLVREGATVVEEVLVGILGLVLLAVEIVALSLSYQALSLDTKSAGSRAP